MRSAARWRAWQAARKASGRGGALPVREPLTWYKAHFGYPVKVQIPKCAKVKALLRQSLGDQLTYAGGERVYGKGLRQHRHARFELAVASSAVRKPGDEECRLLWWVLDPD